MTAREIRHSFINFFKHRKHQEIPSAPLVPENDPTTLFTGSGMQPLVPYLLGEKHPLGTRLVNSQLCFRAEDLEEVGDNRHTTFFEMLGNWSLGDYFKEDQLEWFFTFLTDVLKLSPEKLYVTVFDGDERFKVIENDKYQLLTPDVESVNIWKRLFEAKGIKAQEASRAETKGLQGGRIFYYGAKKNWWSRSGPPENMPIGEPGGPDSEVFYDFGEELGLHKKSSFRDKPCHVNCDCGRFLEIGNSVFMMYKKKDKITFEELPKKNVDFGGGLERLTAATENNPDIFHIDLFTSIIQIIEELSNKQYGQSNGETRAMRIIADHVRGATMLIASGVEPSNKLQGYIVRRLIRRSILHGQKLGFGLTGEHLSSIAEKIISAYEESYPELLKDSQRIMNILGDEGTKFSRTIDKGLREIEKIPTLDAKKAFYLYESYGFPFELTVEIARERGQSINTLHFAIEFAKHKALSRMSSAGMFKGGLADTSEQTVKLHTANHLLQATLRSILGNHVRQKGSNITNERLRFDFTHPSALSKDEIEKVSALVNQKIGENLPVAFEVLDYHQAIKQGALSVPGEKYPAKIRVYSIGTFSKEICGGPHVTSTNLLGRFKIVKEESAGSGIRRIYAKLVS